MSFYYNLHKLDQVRAKRTADGLLRLKEAFKKDAVPERVRSSKLLLATWNVREFESEKYGPRQREALYYIAEIIDHFDIVALQEVREDLSSLEQVMDILGSQGTPGKFKDWRTYQMSDHLPMWIELRVDFSREYLQRIAEGKGAVVPVSVPVKA